MKDNHIEYINIISNTNDNEKYEQLSMFECGEDSNRQ